MKISQLLPILFVILCIQSQAQDTTYFNLQRKKVSVDSADTFEIKTINSELHTRKIENYHLNSLFKISEAIYDDTQSFPTLHGIEKSFYPNGQLHHSANYFHGLKHGELEAYYQNGKVRRQEQFKKGVLKNSIMFDSTGKSIPVCGEWEKNASFPGGTKAYNEYIKQNIKMPEGVKLLKESYSEKVFVKFKIGSNGIIKDIVVLKANRKDTAEEAIRLVQEMPNWIPAEKDCEFIEATSYLPVSFVLK